MDKFEKTLVVSGDGSSLNGWHVNNATVQNGAFNIVGDISQALTIPEGCGKFQIGINVVSCKNAQAFIQLKFISGESYLYPLRSMKQERILEIKAEARQAKLQIVGECVVKAVEVLPEAPPAKDVIVEVIEEKVISVETMHALNAWIRNLYVDYVETNFTDLDIRAPWPTGGVRNYIKIINETMQYITATLSSTETEPLTIVDPADTTHNRRVPVYYTAIGNHEQAYRFFTLTDPREIHKDLTSSEVAAFRVMVRKVVKEEVKMKTEFTSMTTESGMHTVMPMMTWGTGTDPTGQSDSGKGFILKDDKGLVLRYITQTGKVHEFRVGEDGVQSSGGGSLSKADFYTNGYHVEYGNDKVDFDWLKDSQGRIKQLKNRATGQIIPISWNTVAIP